MNSLITVDFHGQALWLIEHDGEPFVPMRRLVSSMGLDWKSQHTKLTGGRLSSTVVEITTDGADGKQRSMLCLPLRKLPGWMMGIHAGKVNPEVRATVLSYQAECDDVLWNYWNHGRADNPRRPHPETIAPLHALEFARLTIAALPNLGESSKQLILSEASQIAFGRRVVPLPRVEEPLLSATQVGQKLGVSANRIGRIANQYGLKCEKYGEYRLNKAVNADRQVESFFYNQRAVSRITAIVGGAA